MTLYGPIWPYTSLLALYLASWPPGPGIWPPGMALAWPWHGLVVHGQEAW